MTGNNTHYVSFLAVVRWFAHGVLVVVSAYFSAVFFHRLGSTQAEAIALVLVALGLELSKVYFLWRSARQMKAPVVTRLLAYLLAAFSVLATATFAYGSLSADYAARTVAVQSSVEVDRAIESVQKQIGIVEGQLADMPAAWRNTRQEAVDQIAELRGELRRLLSEKKEYGKPVTGAGFDRTAFWELVAGMAGIDPKFLIYLTLLAVAILVELAIASTIPETDRTVREGDAYQPFAARVVLDDGVTQRFIELAFQERPGGQLPGIREISATLGESIATVRKCHDRLKDSGVIRTEARRSYQACSRDNALQAVLSRTAAA